MNRMDATPLTPEQATALQRWLRYDALLVALKFEYQFIARAYVEEREKGVPQYEAMANARKRFEEL